MVKLILPKLFPLALLLAAGLACNLAQKVGQGVGQAGPPKTVRSPDGKFQVTVPGSWREDTQLHEEAEIEVSNRLDETYVIVLTEGKEDFADGLTLATFAGMSRDQLTGNIESPEATDPAPTTVGGRPAMQYTMHGVVDNMKATYLITAVETPQHFHQIVTWTLRSRFDKNEKVLRQVTESFRETAGDGPPAPAAADSNANGR